MGFPLPDLAMPVPLNICRRVLAPLAIAGFAALTACRSGGEHRAEADAAAYGIIAEGQEEALGRVEPFTIETPARTLRRRLMIDQNLPYSHPASLDTDQLEPIDHWPDDDYLRRERFEGEPVVEGPLLGGMRLTLDQALQIAAANSREYQAQKEQVFLTALTLDLRRDEFRNTYVGFVNSLLIHDPGQSVDQTGIETEAGLALERQFTNGLSVAARIGFDLAALLSPDRQTSLGVVADLSATLPLLAGSGRHIVTEPLTQAQRNVIYALWDFARFKRTFAVNVASDYLQVLQQADQVANALSNYRRLLNSLERSQALAEAGRLSEIGVDQVRQDVLRARNSWISARERYARQLDQFKLTIGVPTDAAVRLDRDELARLAESAAKRLQDDRDPLADESEYPLQELDEQTSPQGVPEAVADIELPEQRAIMIALAHRLDLRIDHGQIYDAQRQVVVAADALRGALTLRADASAGQGRSLGSAGADNAKLRFEQGRYTVGLDFDLPWEKTAERNAYRAALIDLEQAARALQAREDQVKLDVRNALRSLRQARASYRIQAQAVEVARRRVESTDLFLQAGRAEIRDVLDAQEALTGAQDALTAALVNYRISALELRRDMGVLQADARGLWQEDQP